MYANLTVSHKLDVARDEVVHRFVQVFGTNNPNAAAASVVMKSTPQDVIDYAVLNASFGLYCCIVSDREVQVFVEPQGTDSRRTCQRAWNGVRRALRRREIRVGVRLEDAALVDSSSAEELLHGRVGLGAQLRRSAIYQPIFVGLVTSAIIAGVIALLSLRGQSPPQTAYLAVISGIVNAVWFVGVAVRDWTGRSIQWT